MLAFCTQVAPMVTSVQSMEARNMSNGSGIALGVALGVAWGALFGDLAMSLALGTAFGALLEVATHRTKSAKK